MNVGNSFWRRIGRHLLASYSYSADIGVGLSLISRQKVLLRPAILKWASVPRFSFYYQSSGYGRYRRFYSGLVGFDFQLGSGARLGIVGLGFDFFIRGNFQNSPRLGDRRACHIVYRVDRFDYLGECDRFPGVIISVGMKKEYPVQKDTLSYIAMFETLISPVFQFRYSLSNGERSL